MLNKLPKISQRKAKRLGRGKGSGKGKFSSRGNKGQKSRGTVKSFFEGGQAVLTKRLPMLRGKAKNKSIKPDLNVINLSQLEQRKAVKNNDVVTVDYLVKTGLLNLTKSDRGVKLLGGGVLKKKLTIKIKASEKAIEKVKNAGGEYKY